MSACWLGEATSQSGIGYDPTTVVRIGGCFKFSSFKFSRFILPPVSPSHHPRHTPHPHCPRTPRSAQSKSPFPSPLRSPPAPRTSAHPPPPPQTAPASAPSCISKLCLYACPAPNHTARTSPHH